MRVHLHTVSWNERRLLDYFFRHFEPWVDRFFILDDHSSDGTREYLQARPDVVLGDLERSDPNSWVLSAQQIYNTAWKQSVGEAEWVVVTNIDEHLHHPSIRDYLADQLAGGVTAIPALGYQMVTQGFPAPDNVLWRDNRMGAPWVNMNKLSIFRPDRIQETNYANGRHRARFEGDVRLPERDEVVNLHYKYLGIEYTQKRHEALGARLGSDDIAHGRGHKYGWDENRLREDIASLDLLDVSTLDHHVTHGEPRWWRSQD